MDRTKLINKICPQIAEQPLWREFFDAVIDLSENGYFIESPFKDFLRNRGFLKEFTASFSRDTPGVVKITTQLPKGKYVSETVTPANSNSRIFTEETQLFNGSVGTHKITAIEFYGTEFYKNYLSVMGPQTFTISSLFTLMQASYCCGVTLEGVKFDGSGYWIEYVIAGLYSTGSTLTGGNESLHTNFQLIPYSSDTLPEVGSTFKLGDVLIPKKRLADTTISSFSPRRVIGYTNGLAVVETVSGESSIATWKSGISATETDLLTLRRYFNGYNFNSATVNIDNSTLDNWFLHDAPIQVTTKVVLGFSVNPLTVSLAFLKDSPSARAGISISGNETYRYDLTNFDSTLFALRIENVDIVEGQIYKAPTALQVIALQTNEGSISRSTTFDIITTGNITYTITVVQEASGCIVEVSSGSSTEYALVYGDSPISTPYQVSKGYPLNSTPESYGVNVKCIWPFKIVVKLQDEVYYSDQDPAWVSEEWTADSNDKVVNNFTMLEVDGKITPTPEQIEFTAGIQLPGYDPLVSKVGDSALISAYIILYKGGIEEEYPIIEQTCTGKHLQEDEYHNLNEPLRVQGGMAMQVSYNVNNQQIQCISDCGSAQPYIPFLEYTKRRNGTVYERGTLIHMDQVAEYFGSSVSSNYNAFIVLLGCDYQTWSRLQIDFVQWSSTDVVTDEPNEGSLLVGNQGFIVNRIVQLDHTQGIYNQPMSVMIHYTDTPLVSPEISYTRIKPVFAEYHQSSFYVNGFPWNFACYTALLGFTFVKADFGIITDGKPGMHIQIPDTYRGQRVKSYQTQSGNRLLGGFIEDESGHDIYLTNKESVYLEYAAGGVPWWLCDNFVLEYPKDTIVILCGFGSADFGTRDRLEAPFSMVGEYPISSVTVENEKKFPVCALGAQFFTGGNPLTPSNPIWQGLVETGVSMRSTGSFSTSYYEPVGAWNCWYSSTILLLKAKSDQEIGHTNWRDIEITVSRNDQNTLLLVNNSTKTWFGNLSSGTKQMYLYGYTVSAKDLTQSQLELLDEVEFRGRTLENGVIYSPFLMDQGAVPEGYTADNQAANSIIESLVRTALQNNLITSLSLVKIPISVQFSYVL